MGFDNCRHGFPKWSTGSGKGSKPTRSGQFLKVFLFEQSSNEKRRGQRRRKNWEGESNYGYSGTTLLPEMNDGLENSYVVHMLGENFDIIL